MADNLGPNGLVVSAGKCAASMAAENCYRRKFLLVPFLIFRPFRFFVFFGIITGAGWIFRTKCDFLQVLDLLIFRIERRAIEAHVSNPFSPSLRL